MIRSYCHYLIATISSSFVLSYLSFVNKIFWGPEQGWAKIFQWNRALLESVSIPDPKCSMKIECVSVCGKDFFQDFQFMGYWGGEIELLSFYAKNKLFEACTFLMGSESPIFANSNHKKLGGKPGDGAANQFCFSLWAISLPCTKDGLGCVPQLQLQRVNSSWRATSPLSQHL